MALDLIGDEQRKLTDMTSSEKKSVWDIEVAGKTVLVRVDYNVPFRPGTTEISDDSRIEASLPTLRYLLERRCRVVVCSHLGRPRGQSVEEMRLRPVARRLEAMLAQHVGHTSDCVGPEVGRAVEALEPGDVLLLENLRFHAQEEKNDAGFAQSLASLADVFVNDAFGAAHRAHASTVGVAEHLPAVAGLLMARELEMLGKALGSPKQPFVAVFGGAKVSDKIVIAQRLALKVDSTIVGGGMAATFLKARGLDVGESPVEDEWVPAAAELMEAFGILLPEDVVVAADFSESAAHRVVDVAEIPAGWRIMDIGPDTSAAFGTALASAATVVWNGTMGVAEWPTFANGTARVANAIAGLTDATTVIGGGSTAEAVMALGLADRITHVSTGGGASMEFLEGRELAGVAALQDRTSRPGSTARKV